MYLPNDYVENINFRRIVLDEKQAEWIKRLARGTVLDLGANVGHYTLMMGRRANKVYAYEPEPENFKFLQKNVEFNELKNVILRNSAVGSYNGQIDLHLCDFNNGMHRVYASQYCHLGSIQVDIVRIDDEIKERVDFVKVDTEGAELPIFKGMKQLLQDYHPKIMLEFHPPSILECGDDPKEMYDLLANLGYKFKLLGDTEPDIENISYEQLELITTHNVARNVLCQT